MPSAPKPKRRKKKKRKRVTPMRKLVREADRTMSLYMRALTKKAFDTDLCVFCKVNPIEVNFHFAGRRCKAVRWDVLNTVGSCVSCNGDERFRPDIYRAWYIRTWGAEQYLQLVDRAKPGYKHSREELTDLIEFFSTGYDQLNAEGYYARPIDQ